DRGAAARFHRRPRGPRAGDAEGHHRDRDIGRRSHRPRCGREDRRHGELAKAKNRRRNDMAFKLPNPDQLRKLGAEMGMDITADYANQVIEYITPFAEGYRMIASLSDELPPIKYP